LHHNRLFRYHAVKYTIVNTIPEQNYQVILEIYLTWGR